MVDGTFILNVQSYLCLQYMCTDVCATPRTQDPGTHHACTNSTVKIISKTVVYCVPRTCPVTVTTLLRLDPVRITCVPDVYLSNNNYNTPVHVYTHLYT
jgi:hypothetical protein